MSASAASPGPSDELPVDAGFVRRLARALLDDRELADDVAQDALVAALENGRRGAGGWPSRSWLARVTRNLAARALRGGRERPLREQRVARREADNGEARAVERLHLYRDLAEAVAQLPEPYRTVVTLRYFDGLPPRVIARRRKQGVGAVSQQIHRGLAMLRQRLDDRFGDRSGWVSAFGVLGLGGRTLIPAVLSSIAMKKSAAAALLLLAVGALWIVQRGVPPYADADVRLAASRPAPLVAETTAAASSMTPVQREVLAAGGGAAGAASGLVVQVVDTGGRPQAGATVFAWREEGEPERGETDVRGRVELAPQDAAGSIVVRAPGYMQVQRDLARLAGEVQVMVGAGSALAGIVLVDGQPAAPGLRLKVISAGREPMPRPVGVEMTRNGTAGSVCTEAGGRFHFSGLASDWRGWICVPPAYWLLPQPGKEDDDRHCLLVITAPKTDSVVLATRLPSVSGRVVWDDDGEPVMSASVTALPTLRGGPDAMATPAATDAAGRFTVGFHPSSSSLHTHWMDPEQRTPLAKVVFIVQARDSERAYATFDAAQLLAEGQVLIRVPRTPARHFLAIDAAGVPIAGARALCEAVGKASEPTDADGRGSFVGVRERVLVGAPGYQVARTTPKAAAAGTKEDPLVFVLKPVNRLLLRLRTPEGAVPAARSVELYSTGMPFAGKRPNAWDNRRDLDQWFGGSFAQYTVTLDARGTGGSPQRWGARTGFWADERGSVDVRSLEPEAPAEVVVRGDLGTELVRRALVTPRIGTTLELDLVVDIEPRSLRGRVLTVEGAPLADANVSLSNGAEQTAETITDAAGSFRFTVYDDGPLRVCAQHVGHAPEQRHGVVPQPSGGEEIVFRLGPGREVTVRVVDEQGDAVAADAMLLAGFDPDVCLPPQYFGWGKPQYFGGGRAVFSDLPPGIVTFYCEFGGRRFGLRHDTERPEALLRVPRPARVVVVPPAGYPDPTEGRLGASARRVDAAGEPIPVDIRRDRQEVELLFLPGRHCFVLERVRDWGKWGNRGNRGNRGKEQSRERTPLGPSAEVDLVAGELTRVELR